MWIVISLTLGLALFFTTINTLKYYKLKRNLRLQREFRKFIDTETKLIDIAKWIESEKVGRDLGDAFVSKWISENAAEIRAAWNRSKCRKCSQNCKIDLRIDCNDFKKEKITY
jgi:hypothetical protein